MSATTGASQTKAAKPFSWGRLLEVMIGFTAPPIVGLAILVLVMSGVANADITKSGAATSTALLVGALLMIVPAIVYGVSYQADIDARLKGVVTEGVAAARAIGDKKDGAVPALQAPPSPAETPPP